MEDLWLRVFVASDIKAVGRQKVGEMLLTNMPVYLFEPKVSVSTLFTVVSTRVGSIVREVTYRAL